MKKFKKTIMACTVLAIIGAILILAGCGKSSSSSSTTQTQIYTVKKGNLVSTVSAVGSVDMPEQAKLTFGTGSSTSSLYTVKEIDVAFGDTVKKGDVLAKIDTSAVETTIEEDKINLSTAQKDLKDATSEATILNAQAAVKNAQATLATAEQQLKDMQTSQLTDAQSAVNDAQLALDNAKRSLATTQITAANNIVDAQNSITDAENNVADAQKTYNDFVQANISHLDRWDIAAQKDALAWDLQKAEDSLEKAKDNLDIVKAQGETSIANAQNTVIQAEAALKSAQEDLSQIGSDDPDMLKQEAAVATAKANLITAQDNLAYIQAGSNTELLQIKVDNAQAQLDNDNAQLEAATMVAPFDGVVGAINADVGDKVTATQEIIYLVNTSKVEISSSVDETDVAKVKAGQTAVVTFDAIEGASIKGTVGAISPVASSSSNVVTYSFSVEIQDTQGYALKEGMTAAADIVVLNKTGVLLVPSAAITRSGPNSVVQVETASGTTEQRVIKTGDTNGTYTEVTSGLSEGDKILVKTSTTSSSASSTRSSGQRIFIGPGGGGPSFQVGP